MHGGIISLLYIDSKLWPIAMGNGVKKSRVMYRRVMGPRGRWNPRVVKPWGGGGVRLRAGETQGWWDPGVVRPRGGETQGWWNPGGVRPRARGYKRPRGRETQGGGHSGDENQSLGWDPEVMRSRIDETQGLWAPGMVRNRAWVARSKEWFS